ncbi:AfsR/SARP family transcriptional regulator [Jiangella alba]|uniref:DNA-binding transcriptional activator of the SARP family n=1 Tax=Jiangella alba TaxID=561176 RepID=A0A1H5PLR8_9ACTN|nr:BTAD domain-containing putative transcriptional regulator [Jiangella alba]SEF13917.1 DNA-binding transcriptional activator of the SARP family [Jiangella alba]
MTHTRDLEAGPHGGPGEVAEPGAQLDIRLLGAVEVRRDGQPVPVPSGRPAVVLAALALRPGGVVSHGTLARLLWPDAQPEHPRAALQTHVTRVRAVLGRTAVESTGDGYRLELPPDVVDVTRLRGLSAAARALGDLPGRLALLDQALLLWRGNPLAGLWPDVLTRQTAPSLLDEVLSVAERAHELRLALHGPDDGVIRELRALVNAYPERERAAGQLMIALYREGRQGDALGVFHGTIQALRAAGRRPGPELAALHARLLTGDDLAAPDDARGLAAAPSGPSAEPRPAPVAVPAGPGTRPAQLPSRPPSFVGRAEEVATLTAALRDDAAPAGRCRTVVVSGPGGTGKTTLALRVAHEVLDRYPDGQLFADLRTSSDAAALGTDALAGLLRALGVGGPDLPPCPLERAELFRRLCTGRRLLVLMDDADPDTVGSLLPAESGCAVIVTSRRRIPDLPADARADLGMFSEPEARELLASVVGADRLAAEPGATTAVLDRCAGSPLAVRIAAGRLATRPAWPIEHFAGRLSDGDRLGELRAGGLAVRAMLDATYVSLQPVQAQRYRLLAALTGATVEAETAAVVWEVDVDDARRLLDRLADIRLLEAAPGGGYGWHDLVDDHIRAVADPVAAKAARHRLLGHLLLTLRNARLRLRPVDSVPGVPEPPDDCPPGRPFADRSEIHAWLHPRRTQLVALARAELAAGEYPAVDHAAGLLVLLDAVARECCDSGDDEEAARTVLAAATPPSHPGITAAAWTNLTLTLAAQHRLDEAVAAADHAVRLRRELGDRYGELIMFENQACIHVEAGRYQDAVDVIAACVADREFLSAQVRARCLRTRARAYAGLGRCADARADLAAADAVETPAPVSYDAHYAAAVTTAVHRAAGDRDAALRSCRQAVDIAVALGSTWMRALSLLDTARTLRHFGADGRRAAADAVAVAVENRHVRLAAEARAELTLAGAGR